MCVVKELCLDSMQGCAQDCYIRDVNFLQPSKESQTSLDSGVKSDNIFS